MLVLIKEVTLKLLPKLGQGSSSIELNLAMLKRLFSLFCFVAPSLGSAQFAPPPGQEGSTAFPADSSIFVTWATACEVERGWQNIADTTLGMVSFGTSADGLGQPDNAPVSLGDGGIATLTFEQPIRNGEGFDFAVFENAFDDTFLELAFVEVSSDGQLFFRFPATSNTPTGEQVGTFGSLDATKINDLAGKYRSFFGTPFDLEELKGNEGLDLNRITHVRLVDVVGSILPAFSTFDGNGQIVNDPFPTPFESGGFDLDAVGVIHQATVTAVEVDRDGDRKVQVFPNPVKRGTPVFIRKKDFPSGKDLNVKLFSQNGRLLDSSKNVEKMDTFGLPPGIYFLSIEMEGRRIIKKLLVIY